MNREIKFRGKSLNGAWYYGNLTILKHDIDSVRKAGYYISNSAGMPFAYAVRPETVGEYIGRKDKNGTDIYEGDVVGNKIVKKEFIHEGTISGKMGYVDKAYHSKGIVSYDSHWCQFQLLHPKVHEYGEFEIIGNVHDNPNMIENVA